jgi:autotransporter-associated beta strand protein
MTQFNLEGQRVAKNPTTFCRKNVTNPPSNLRRGLLKLRLFLRQAPIHIELILNMKPKTLAQTLTQNYFARVTIAVLLCYLTINRAIAQNATTNVWQNSGSAWLTTGHWSLNHVPTSSEDAQFAITSTTTAQINMSTVSGSESVGALEMAPACTKDLTLNNSSSTAGILTVAGVTVNNVANVILHNNSGNNLIVQDGTGGNATMGLALGNATANVINLDGSGGITISDIISSSSGTTPLTFGGAGSGQIAVNNTANTFTGNINIVGTAEVRFAADGSLGNSANSITVDGGRLAITSGTSVTIASGRSIFLGSTPGTSISAPGSAGVLAYSGVLANKSGATGILVKQGAGTLALGGVSTYSGGTSNNNGTIQLTTGSNRLPTGTTVYLGSSGNTCVLDLNGNSQQIAGLNSQAATANIVTNSSTTSATLTISGSGSSTFGGANPGVISGAINLVVNGSSTLNLAGVNTYTGGTTISNTATLALSGSGSIANSSSITIASNATLDVSGLTTALTLGNSQTLIASGNGAAGTIATTTAKGLTLGATGALKFTAYDGANPPLTITGAGSVTLAAGNVVAVTNLGSPLTPTGGDGNGNYKLISKGSSGGVTGTVPSSVTVGGSGGLAPNSVATLAITGGELFLHVSSSAIAPSISIQPTSLTNNINSSAVFSVTASGTTLAYFWQKTNSAAGSFTNLLDAGAISGSGTASLTNSSVQVADAGAYRVIITNSAGAVTSSVVTLTVIDPAITTQPASRTNAIGETATFTVIAAGNGLTYQWYQGVSALSTGGNIYGATSSSLVVSNLVGNSAGNYSVVVTDASGSVTSSVAALTIRTPFTTRNLAVVRMGDGSANLTSAGTPEFVDEYNPAGTLVQSIALPTNGVNALVDSGSATSDGALSRAADGSAICVPGYNASVGTPSITGTSAASVPREVASLSAGAGFTIAASTTTQFSANNLRSAATDGTNNFWGAGGSSGTFYFGTAAAANTVQSVLANARVINIFNGNLYFTASAGGGLGLYSIAGLPTTASPVVTNILTASGSSPNGFAINPADTVVYIADDNPITSTGGIQKWTNNAGSWSLAYTLTNAGTGSRGLAVDFSGANPVIYATTTENISNRLITITDTNFNAVATTLATAGTNTIFRGVTFTPESAPVVVTPPQNQTNGIGSTAAFTSAGDGAAALAAQWQSSGDGGVTFTNIPGATSTAYSFTATNTDNARQFRVIYSNAYGAVTSSVATLTTTKVIPGDSLTSSAATNGYRVGVTFTNTLSADATGYVLFQTNNVLLSSNNVSGGIAVSVAVTNLPRGTNLITAIYSGDTKYFGFTNYLNQVVTNHPPVANTNTYSRSGLPGWKISVSDLLTNASDADGDALSLVGLGVSTNGIALDTNSTPGYVQYYNASLVDDRFSYTVTDGFGGTNTAVITLTAVNPGGVGGQAKSFTMNGGTASMIFAGIPGYKYHVQVSTNLSAWNTIWTTNAPVNGVFQFNDSAAPMPDAFYRLLWNGN